MRSLIISIFLLLVLVAAPKHVFAEPLSPDLPHIDVADIFYAPLFNDTGLFGVFGGYCGGDSGSQIVDWSIGNTIPHSSSMTDDIVFSTCLGNYMNPDNWKERMRITKEGTVNINSDMDVDAGTLHVDGGNHRVGIGTSSPPSKLSVVTNDDATDIANFINSNTIGPSHGVKIETNSNSGAAFSILRGDTLAELFYVDNTGNVGIGATVFGSGIGILSLRDATTKPTVPLIGAAALYASGGELFAYDAAGNATQISPHDKETGEWIFYSKNTKTGRVVRINMEKLVKKFEELTGESFMEEWIEE